MQREQVLERLVLAEHLHECGDRGVRRPRGVRVRHLHLARELGLDQVLPARRRCDLLLGEQLGVVADAEHAEVDADRPVLRLLRLPLRPWIELREQRRLVLLGQTLLGGLQVRVARAAEPHVELGIGLLGGELRDRFPGALRRDRDADAGIPLELGGDRVAPFALRAADDVELLLGAGLRRRAETQRERDRRQRAVTQRFHRNALPGGASPPRRRQAAIIHSIEIRRVAAPSRQRVSAFRHRQSLRFAGNVADIRWRGPWDAGEPVSRVACGARDSPRGQHPLRRDLHLHRVAARRELRVRPGQRRESDPPRPARGGGRAGRAAGLRADVQRLVGDHRRQARRAVGSPFHHRPLFRFRAVAGRGAHRGRGADGDGRGRCGDGAARHRRRDGERPRGAALARARGGGVSLARTAWLRRCGARAGAGLRGGHAGAGRRTDALARAGPGAGHRPGVDDGAGPGAQLPAEAAARSDRARPLGRTLRAGVKGLERCTVGLGSRRRPVLLFAALVGNPGLSGRRAAGRSDALAPAVAPGRRRARRCEPRVRARLGAGNVRGRVPAAPPRRPLRSVAGTRGDRARCRRPGGADRRRHVGPDRAQPGGKRARRQRGPVPPHARRVAGPRLHDRPRPPDHLRAGDEPHGVRSARRRRDRRRRFRRPARCDRS